MNQNFFLPTSLRFYSALVIFEPQIYVVVEQFDTENISLLSGRLVLLILPTWSLVSLLRFRNKRDITTIS